MKNYSGTLAGDADDFEWEKLHMSQGGNIYIKTVKNPIRQVKRQIYILAKYLDYYGVRTWVEGYVYMCDAESPVEDEHIQKARWKMSIFCLHWRIWTGRFIQHQRAVFRKERLMRSQSFCHDEAADYIQLLGKAYFPKNYGKKG